LLGERATPTLMPRDFRLCMNYFLGIRLHAATFEG
jgi:hypothetical protein